MNTAHHFPLKDMASGRGDAQSSGESQHWNKGGDKTFSSAKDKEGLFGDPEVGHQARHAQLGKGLLMMRFPHKEDSERSNR